MKLSKSLDLWNTAKLVEIYMHLFQSLNDWPNFIKLNLHKELKFIYSFLVISFCEGGVILGLEALGGVGGGNFFRDFSVWGVTIS